MLRDPVGRLRIVGWAEGASFLVLLGVAMPLKYLAGWPMAVRVVGMAHGGLFLLYLIAVARAGRAAHWSVGIWLQALAAAVVPGGPFLLDGKLRRAEDKLARERLADA